LKDSITSKILDASLKIIFKPEMHSALLLGKPTNIIFVPMNYHSSLAHPPPRPHIWKRLQTSALAIAPATTAQAYARLKTRYCNQIFSLYKDSSLKHRANACSCLNQETGKLPKLSTQKSADESSF
jgi:hypothetical protein